MKEVTLYYNAFPYTRLMEPVIWEGSSNISKHAEARKKRALSEIKKRRKKRKS